MTVLEARNIIKIYGEEQEIGATRALKGISLKVEKGEFVGVMGPSGSGKTTLLNILSGLDRPTSGSIILSDQDICEMSDDDLAVFRRKNLGFVFQEFNLLDSLTLKENVMLPMILDKKDTQKMESIAYNIMAMFDIQFIGNKYPCNVSGGQQQRTVVSRALVNEPDIVFADEPTGNLDSKSARDVMKCFEKMNSEKECTILVVTHDPFAASYCKKVVFIKDGLINMEIVKKDSRRNFFDKILDCLAVVGGERDDF